ncbi:MAG: family 1 glycosylhydrolase [Pseudomonadota bacterium]
MISNIPFNPSFTPNQPEIWAGIECTVARIGNKFRNQISETGHLARPRDLENIAALGIRTLRYPVLWETIAPGDPDRLNWHWHDRQLGQLLELGIAPIAGLMHHGSGPLYTDLLDPAMPLLLARYAEQVAARYPWIDMYTPVNEPLTTARFSGLYGHWYPHGNDHRCFLRILLNQCRAIVLSMRAIRRVTPSARLVQTEDLGKVFSTPALQYQADYENQRRWLSFDLLCGRIDRKHPWYRIFLEAGIAARELDFFVNAPCPPDIIGINHYLTSDRFLDDRLAHYPDRQSAGNQRDRYVDVEAARVDLPSEQLGPEARLREVHLRYQLPMAVTEVHNGGTRDEQLRWLMDVWNAACKLRSQGADLRAVTVWSLLGCVDWNTLLTEHQDHYESGVFDVRCNPLRPTALAAATASLIASGTFDHPVLQQQGWWRRDTRFYLPKLATTIGACNAVSCDPLVRQNLSRIAIAGSTGTLGQAFARVCQQRGLDYELLARADMDIADAASVEAALTLHRPWAVINAAGYVRVAQAEHNPAQCFRENAHGAQVLADACAKLGIAYVTFSSDLVFDGLLGRAYVESDQVCPTGTYGVSKAEAERLTQKVCPQALIIRSSAFFGPWDRNNFAYKVLHELGTGQALSASVNNFVSPTYVPDLANAVLDLLIDGATGVWHLTNQGVLSWHEFASHIARKAGVDASSLNGSESVNSGVTALSSERGLILPAIECAVHRFVKERAFL